MTNRDQIAWAFAFGDYDDRTVAEIIAEMLDATGTACLLGSDRDRLERWLGLECDPETNNWGVLEGAE